MIGFLVGGVVGWASVPAQWTASLWTTIEAAGNSARYGESFEHMAERALMYFSTLPYSANLRSALLRLSSFGGCEVLFLHSLDVIVGRRYRACRSRLQSSCSARGKCD